MMRASHSDGLPQDQLLIVYATPPMVLFWAWMYNETPAAAGCSAAAASSSARAAHAPHRVVGSIVRSGACRRAFWAGRAVSCAFNRKRE